jgi:hypothetical protein
VRSLSLSASLRTSCSGVDAHHGFGHLAVRLHLRQIVRFQSIAFRMAIMRNHAPAGVTPVVAQSAEGAEIGSWRRSNASS